MTREKMKNQLLKILEYKYNYTFVCTTETLKIWEFTSVYEIPVNDHACIGVSVKAGTPPGIPGTHPEHPEPHSEGAGIRPRSNVRVSL
jgi:hypothetical protein